MAPRRTLTALVAALALAAPSAALAQSAGDEQYADPFGGSNGGSQGSDGGSQGSNGSGESNGSSGTTAPATSTPAPATSAPTSTSTTTSTTPATTTTPAATTAATGGQQLPYTGAPVGLVVLAGVLLLGGGVALRVRLRERDD
jgi:LPXTG-motif cell wall-anchored protein